MEFVGETNNLILQGKGNSNYVPLKGQNESRHKCENYYLKDAVKFISDRSIFELILLMLRFT